MLVLPQCNFYVCSSRLWLLNLSLLQTSYIHIHIFNLQRSFILAFRPPWFFPPLPPPLPSHPYPPTNTLPSNLILLLLLLLLLLPPPPPPCKTKLHDGNKPTLFM